MTATQGCPIDPKLCNRRMPSKLWTIKAAILKGPHSSATDLQALIPLQEETAEKVKTDMPP